MAVAFDSSGDLAVADTSDSEIRLVLNQSSTTLFGIAMTKGDIYTIAGTGHQGNGCTSTGIGRPSVQLDLPAGVAFAPSGDGIVLSQSDGFCVQFVSNAGSGYLCTALSADVICPAVGDGTAGFSGDGGIADGSQLSNTLGLSVDSAGNLAIADFGNDRVRFVPDNSGSQFGQPFMTQDDIHGRWQRHQGLLRRRPARDRFRARDPPRRWRSGRAGGSGSPTSAPTGSDSSPG